MISIAATTKSKSSNPIFKTSLTLNSAASILRCVTINKQLQLQLHHLLFHLLEAHVCVFELFVGSVSFKMSAYQFVY
jgi:hypothetical protein